MSNYICVELGHKIWRVAGWHGSFHLLHDMEKHEAVLIDAGLMGEMERLRKTLASAELEWRDIKAILLTHGHLDHTGNLARIKGLTGAPVMAHPLEQAHVDGRFPYRGAARICGWMEAFGRTVLRYRPVKIDEPLAPDQLLPFWSGLRVVHLPGHTQGHCGFYSERFGVLFSGDLFADYWFSRHLPPPFLNCCPELFTDSLCAVQKLAPRLVVPNHYDRELTPERHARSLMALVARRLSSSP